MSDMGGERTLRPRRTPTALRRWLTSSRLSRRLESELYPIGSDRQDRVGSGLARHIRHGPTLRASESSAWDFWISNDKGGNRLHSIH